MHSIPSLVAATSDTRPHRSPDATGPREAVRQAPRRSFGCPLTILVNARIIMAQDGKVGGWAGTRWRSSPHHGQGPCADESPFESIPHRGRSSTWLEYTGTCKALVKCGCGLAAAARG